MSGLFARDYAGGGFEFLGKAHLAALMALAILNLYLLRYRNTDESSRKKVRGTLALILWGNEVAGHY